VQRDLTVAQGRQAEIERDLRLADAERSTFVAESRRQVREELAQASRDSQEIGEQLQKARRRSELVTLVAPTDAVVLEIRQTSAGSVLTQSETFAVLVPLEGRLMAEADVAPEDVGEIRVGDAVRLKIDAFPFQRHGVLEGRVATISRDAFTPPAGEATRPAVFYRMRVELVSARFARGGEAQTLLPGMTLSAEAIVGRRSVLSYFLYPLIRTLDESIRER
jgi:HlyD family secretion protein